MRSSPIVVRVTPGFSWQPYMDQCPKAGSVDRDPPEWTANQTRIPVTSIPQRVLMRPVRILRAQISDRRGERVGHDVGHVAPGQGVQERFEILLLLLGQSQWTDQRRQQLVRHAATVVEVDDLAQCVEAAVVHVGRSQRDVAQRLRSEPPAIAGALGNPVQPEIIGKPLLGHRVDGSSGNLREHPWRELDPGGLRLAPAHRGRVAETGVVELVIDEQRVVRLHAVADDALRLAGEEREPALDGRTSTASGSPPKYHRSNGESAASSVRW